ncbi:hypothetical protein PR048_001939 [Dryococelus australis]|uniref:Uncharacterized protein n=1 Tax=Dryococelus australis TaxID=614101 RepID=A0ABQ9IIR4_9NEOP|nr:hypothetical protein PR048_001939 [Dryococelus australis]
MSTVSGGRKVVCQQCVEKLSRFEECNTSLSASSRHKAVRTVAVAGSRRLSAKEVNVVNCTKPPCKLRRKSTIFLDVKFTPGAVVAERLACLPPFEANGVQTPAGSLPDFRMWESCPTMPLAGGFLGDLPFPLPLHSGAAPISLRFTLIGSQYFAVKSRPNLLTHRTLLKK